MPEYILYTVSEEMHSGELEDHDYELDNASMPGILSHLKAGKKRVAKAKKAAKK